MMLPFVGSIFVGWAFKPTAKRREVLLVGLKAHPARVKRKVYNG